MPKLGSPYDMDNYFKDYYKKNKDRYNNVKHIYFTIELDGKEYVFKNKKDILKLIKRKSRKEDLQEL